MHVPETTTPHHLKHVNGLRHDIGKTYLHNYSFGQFSYELAEFQMNLSTKEVESKEILIYYAFPHVN